MAYEVISRMIGEMPPERFEKLLLSLPEEKLFLTLSRLPSELEQGGKERMAYEVISRIIAEMPPERREELLLNLPAETLFGTLNRLPAEQLQAILAGLPKEQLQKALEENSGGTTSINKKEMQR